METQKTILLYRISQPYLQFLHQIESKVMCNKDGLYDRPHVGILLQQNEHKYFAPLSSYKPKHDRINNHSIFKISDTNGRKLSVIQFNNMIPILDSEITEMNFDDEAEDYKILLQKEYFFIDRNSEEICQKAEKLYRDVVVTENPFFVKISNNFVLLEEKYKEFAAFSQSESL